MLVKILRGAFDLARAPFQKDEYTRVLERMEAMRKHFGGEKGAQELPEYNRLEKRCEQLEKQGKAKMAPVAQP